MRQVGVVTSARGLVPTAHLCWGYTERSELRDRVTEFFHDGLAEGQYVELVGAGEVGWLTDRVRGLPGAEEAMTGGRLAVRTAEEYFVMAAPGVVDPAASVDRRAREVREAVQRGRSGYRSVVDATSVVATPQAAAAFARFEHLLDAEATRLPLAALCAYDLGRVGRRTVSHLAALHPLAGPGTGTVHVHAEAGVDLALSGEADGAAAEALAAALGTVLPLLDGCDLRIGAGQLRFVDHRTLLLLDQILAGQGRTAGLRSPSPTVARLAGLLPLKALRVEEVSTL